MAGRGFVINALERFILLHFFVARKADFAPRVVFLQVNLVDDVFAHPDELLHARRCAHVFKDAFALEVVEREQRGRTHAVLPGELLLRGVAALEIDDIDIALDVDAQV
jgi:hypothetical protein